MITDKTIADQLSTKFNSGYWVVNNTYFFNKAECLRYATRINDTSVSYHFFDHIFYASDWSVEPKESLDQLYMERAKQIRDKYDYIILSISGGSDSMNMLYAFINSGLRVDEIVTFYPVQAIEKLLPTFDYDEKSPVNVMFEYVTAFLPQIEKINKLYPSIKITVLDHTNSVLDTMGKANAYKFDMAGLTMGPGTAGPLLVVDHQRKLNKPNSAIITGIDKPRIVYCPNTNRFATYFLDFHSMWGGVSEAAFSGFKPTVEYFYYAWEFPQILKKQAHVIKRALTPIIHGTDKIMPQKFKELCTPRRAKYPYDVMNIQHSFFEQLIYPTTYNPKIFQAAKPTSLLFAEANNWFTHSPLTEDRLKSFYEGQIMEFIAGVGNNFLYRNAEGRIGGFNPIPSKAIFF